MNTSKQSIIPMLSYEDGVTAIEWLCNVFGFSETARMLGENGELAHGEITMNDNIIMLACPTPDYQSPNKHRQTCKAADNWYQSPYIINGVLVYVDDVEAHYKNAKKMGATILSELEAGFPGTRYRAEDLEGQRWMFMQKE